MIVRIMGEGQVRLADGHLTELKSWTTSCWPKWRRATSPGFRRTLEALLAKVRELGEPLPDDSLEPSELILPSQDATLEDVQELLSDDGLIPG
ncbi:F0F1 ATP synthase OS=Streptomyces alboniger OX=132473 GN=CP975_09530 PE=4 SV=1 [Streptomyces alboniger]